MRGDVTSGRKFRARLAAQQPVYVACVAVKDAQRRSGLDEGDAGELPVVQRITNCGWAGSELRDVPHKVHHEALRSIIVCGTIGRMADIELVVGGKQQLGDVKYTFA